MSWRIWRIRQFACIDVDGKVVDVAPKTGIRKAVVVGWRVRWDAPGYPERSRTVMKSRFKKPTAAFNAAEAFVDELKLADRYAWPADGRGRPQPPAEPAPDQDRAASDVTPTTLKALGEAQIKAAGGRPKTIQGRETSLKFLLGPLPEGIDADDVTSLQLQEALTARRYTPSIRSRKLVRMGVLHPDDERARMCSVRTEELFVQDVRRFFRFGLEQKPPCVVGDPTVGMKARKRSEEPADPSAEATFAPEQTLGIAKLVRHRVDRDVIIVRGFTALRTGEAASADVDGVDFVNRQITVEATEGEAPARLTPDGRSRTTNHLKHREPGDTRSVDWPDDPFFDELMRNRVAEARRLHAKREATLRRRLARYRSEKAKQHLVKKTEADLHAHTSSSPRLFTSPTGAPFCLTRLDSKVWKPALAQFFPVADPTDPRYNPLRESRFYNLRSAAIELLNEEGEMKESDVADMAGHSVETQRRHYRKRRGGVARPRSTALDAAASAAIDSVFGAPAEAESQNVPAATRWMVRRLTQDGPEEVGVFETRHEAEAASVALEGHEPTVPHWVEPARQSA